MKKVIFKEIENCGECPYFRYQSEREHSYSDNWDSWYECGFTDKILTRDSVNYGELKIPDWCPLEDEDLFYKAINIVRDENIQTKEV